MPKTLVEGKNKLTTKKLSNGLDHIGNVYTDGVNLTKIKQIIKYKTGRVVMMARSFLTKGVMFLLMPPQHLIF